MYEFTDPSAQVGGNTIRQRNPIDLKAEFSFS